MQAFVTNQGCEGRPKRVPCASGGRYDPAASLIRGQDLILQVCDELGIGLTPRLSLFPRDPDGRFSGASLLRNQVLVGGKVVTGVAGEVQDAQLAVQRPNQYWTLSAYCAGG